MPRQRHQVPISKALADFRGFDKQGVGLRRVALEKRSNRREVEQIPDSTHSCP
jgi:hypothetical protein